MKFHISLFIFQLLSLTVLSQTVNVYDRPVQHEPSHSFDVLHYRIALTFEGENRAFEGETTITLRALQSDFDTFTLDAETYAVRTVRSIDEQPLAFSHQNGNLTITLPEAKSYGDTLQVIVAYGTEYFEVDPTQFGMSANYPLGIGFFPATGDQPFLFNAYSFPTGARHWFPCYDHPNDRATHETIITTSGNHKVLANGLLKSVTPNADGTVTYHWSQDQAHPTYLYNFVSGPYVKVEDSYRGIPVNYWVYPQDEDKALRSFHRTPEVLAFFEDYYGVEYPWDKYDQIVVPGIGGGAEATTATLIGVTTLHDERADPDFPSHWLIAHEAAHHWWGNFINYRDWTETWLSESFATFSEYLYSAHLYGPEEGALNLYDKRSTYLNEAKNQYQRPIVFNRWEYPNQNFDRHTYQKGALVLNMLRDYLGEDIFRRVLKHFLNAHAYHPVDTHDFMKSIWEVTGQNLDWFFEQWIYGAGHPVLDIDYEWKDEQVYLTVKQLQDTSDHIPLFKMPVKIAVTIEGETVVHQTWIKDKEQTISFACPSQPLLVRFDPENVLLKEWTFNKPKAELLFQAEHDDVIGRRWAVQQLGEHLDDPATLAFLKAVALQDHFWAVRREALQALGQGDDAITEILREAIEDSHSRVRAAAVSLLGEMKNKDLRDLFKERYENDSSYLVQAAAVRALGKLRIEGDRSFLEEVVQQKSPRNVLRNAAMGALEDWEDK